MGSEGRFTTDVRSLIGTIESNHCHAGRSERRPTISFVARVVNVVWADVVPSVPPKNDIHTLDAVRHAASVS